MLHLALAIAKVSKLLRGGERKERREGERTGIAKGTDGEGLVLWVSYLAH